MLSMAEKLKTLNLKDLKLPRRSLIKKAIRKTNKDSKAESVLFLIPSLKTEEKVKLKIDYLQNKKLHSGKTVGKKNRVIKIIKLLQAKFSSFLAIFYVQQQLKIILMVN